MIPKKIEALFQFVAYLHSNIENFKQFDNVVKELNQLEGARSKLSPQENFADKLESDRLQAEIKDKFNVVMENIIQPIRTKALELEISEWVTNGSFWNGYISEILNLKASFSETDIPVIQLHGNLYIEFRTKTNCDYFQMPFLGLDRILKDLFCYFNKGAKSEFELFEVKTIHVGSLAESFELLREAAGGVKKTDIDTRRKKINPAFEDFLNADGKKLIEHLKSEYHQAAPEDVFYMLKSLEKSGCLSEKILSMNQTHLSNALTEFLGFKYSRQGLNLSRTEDSIKLITHQNRIIPPPNTPVK
jgi:hypothetical protein